MPAFLLDSPERTAELAAILAEAMAAAPFSVLMRGPLGSGKTTLVRSLVAALPGGEDAEVSSPSFTVCNLYPTRPPAAHCDLYRLGPGGRLPEEVLEAVDEGERVLLCEWAEHLPPDEEPRDRLHISFDFLPEFGEVARTLAISAQGPNAMSALALAARRMSVALSPDPAS